MIKWPKRIWLIDWQIERWMDWWMDKTMLRTPQQHLRIISVTGVFWGLTQSAEYCSSVYYKKSITYHFRWSGWLPYGHTVRNEKNIQIQIQKHHLRGCIHRCRSHLLASNMSRWFLKGWKVNGCLHSYKMNLVKHVKHRVRAALWRWSLILTSVVYQKLTTAVIINGFLLPFSV